MSQKASCVPAENWTPQLLLLCSRQVYGQVLLSMLLQLPGAKQHLVHWQPHCCMWVTEGRASTQGSGGC
jgi:hypothetical protein